MLRRCALLLGSRTAVSFQAVPKLGRHSLTLSSLSREECEPCTRGVGISPMSRDEALALAQSIPLWELDYDGVVPQITRHIVCRNFQAALDFVARAGEVMEAQGHHADVHIENYREVRLELHTHFIGGLHRNDFILASKLDEVPMDLSPKFRAALEAARPAGGHVAPGAQGAP